LQILGKGGSQTMGSRSLRVSDQKGLSQRDGAVVRHRLWELERLDTVQPACGAIARNRKFREIVRRGGRGIMMQGETVPLTDSRGNPWGGGPLQITSV